MATVGNITNPFSVTSYIGPEYFCGRETESEALFSALFNRRNVTLISKRKLGKTGLIHHFLNNFSKKEAFCFYIDIDGTANLDDFVKVFGEEVLGKAASISSKLFNGALAVLSSLRPTFETDSITGNGKWTLTTQNINATTTLKSIFEYLEKAPLPCYVAFDEFQTIKDYPEKKVEAILRSHIQHLNNVHFVFAGSKKNIMLRMFTDVEQPFYQSTQIMTIWTIAEETYYEFADKHLSKHGQKISRETFSQLYRKVDGNTWAIQNILNRLYQLKSKELTPAEVSFVIQRIVEEFSEGFKMYCTLVSQKQKELLKAIAHEGYVKEIMSKDFLNRYQLGAASTVSAAAQVLTDKELVYLSDTGEYSIYNPFFAIYLRS